MCREPRSGFWFFRNFFELIIACRLLAGGVFAVRKNSQRGTGGRGREKAREKGVKRQEMKRLRGSGVYSLASLYQLQRLHNREAGRAYPRPIIPVVGAESYMRCI